VLKLLICLISAALIAICVLQLRQQNLQLGHQCNELSGKIRGRQAKLWSQQLQIAVYTAPNAISQTVANHDLKLVPQTPPPAGKPNWIDVQFDPDAEGERE
jgi:cell division protein FtsL